MIEKWNSVVKENDLVIHCGDFALCSREKFDPLIRSLNGRKVLIKGNHDARSWRFYIDNNRFSMVCKYFSLKGVLFTHRPADFFSLTHEENINVHGHIHNLDRESGFDTSDQKRINVSVEKIDYTPVNFDDILARRD